MAAWCGLTKPKGVDRRQVETRSPFNVFSAFHIMDGRDHEFAFFDFLTQSMHRDKY